MTLFAMLLTVGVSFLMQDPVVSFTPIQPTLGQAVTIRYDTAHKNASLKGEEPAYAVIQRLETDWAGNSQRISLRREGTQWVGEVPGDAKVASLAVYFLTRSQADIRNSLNIVFRTFDGKPARCAEGSKLEANWTQPFEREMANYSDNVYAHRQKWFAASAFAKDKLEDTVRSDLAKLEGMAESPALLATRVYASIQLGDEPRARECLLRLIAVYPESHFVDRAASDYEYGIYAKSLKGEGPDAAKVATERFRLSRIDEPRHRDHLLNLSTAGKLSPEQAERASLAWMADQPDHPWPYHAWAMADFRAKNNLGRAEANIEKALDLYLDGSLRTYIDMQGSVTGILLPGAFRSAAEISLANGHFAKALAHVRAAQSFDKALTGDAHEIEGRVWKAIGRTDDAKGAFEEAHRRGSKEAEASLRELHLRRQGRPEDFEAYISGLTDSPAVVGAVAGPLAPLFASKSLDGATYDLAALKGKVVVLNFWFIGCAPCRVEMPSLNKLVEAYQSNKDVVFLAFANDAEKELRVFLNKTPFKYKVIANGSTIAAKYGVSAFPGHFVIGRDGKISSQSIGGSETIDQDLKRRIDRALSAK